MPFNLEKREIYVAIIFSVVGYVLSTTKYILWRDSISIFTGLIVSYLIYFVLLYLLKLFNVFQFPNSSNNWKVLLAIILISFSILIITDLGSPYPQHIINEGTEQVVSSVYFQNPNGATWVFWKDIVGILDYSSLRLVTFVLTPFFSTLLAGYLFTGRKLRS